MMIGLLCLLACQMLGEILAYSLQLPVPGPVIGIVVLALLIAVDHRLTGFDPTRNKHPVGQTADDVLRFLGLLFVPAGVGVIEGLTLLSVNALAVTIILVGATLITLLVTAAVFFGMFHVMSGKVGSDGNRK